jgi:hypothetical protein
MKISNLVEQIFAQAVALDQSGGLRNTIFAMGNEIFILNYDHTVLLRFKLRATEGTFEHPISFKANDYDSNVFEEVDGRVVFTTEKGEYMRKKTCGKSDLTEQEVKELYQKFTTESSDTQTISLSKDVLTLLDMDLSHIEFSGKVGESIRMIQRNIYSGGIVEINKVNKGLFKEEITEDFGPVAIKTGDFQALFTFQDSLKFSFPNTGTEDFLVVKGGDVSKRNFTGIIACCLYDEIIKIKEVVVGQSSLMRRRK